ncbi:unnamed protein product [Meloidogyne enterolobii]|uniref:Uncharacterized protein n=1 Tax=Meloidogyne enterolobii TaxID=390850 RepID=A0ACB0Y7K5_MELEN
MQGCLVSNFLGFSVPQKWLPYTPGLNPWIYVFGQFWRQSSLLNNPKVWSHSDNHSFRNGKKLHQKLHHKLHHCITLAL